MFCGRKDSVFLDSAFTKSRTYVALVSRVTQEGTLYSNLAGVLVFHGSEGPRHGPRLSSLGTANVNA